MNTSSVRMLSAAVGLAAVAAVLASTASATVPEGAVVPAEIYAASTSPLVSEQHTPQASGTFFVDPEIYAASTLRDVLEQQTARWSGTFGVDPEIWATLDPAIKAAIQTRSHVATLAREQVGAVARALPYLSYLGNRSRIGSRQARHQKTAALPHGSQVGRP